MAVSFPDFLVAVDKKRERIFVLEKPHLMAVRIGGEWNYGVSISDEEIEKNYELVTDVQLARKIIAEAKSQLSLT